MVSFYIQCKFHDGSAMGPRAGQEHERSFRKLPEEADQEEEYAQPSLGFPTTDTEWPNIPGF